LTPDEFQTKFQIKTNFLQYFQLIAAIPSDLEKKTTTHAAPAGDLLVTTTISPFPGKKLFRSIRYGLKKLLQTT